MDASASGNRPESRNGAWKSIRLTRASESRFGFRVAIFENLLNELAKTKQFKQVLRSGDRNAVGAGDLLILRTTVQKYTREVRLSAPLLL